MQSGTRISILLVFWSCSAFARPCQYLQSSDSPRREGAPACLQAEFEPKSSQGRLLIQRSTRDAHSLLSKDLGDQNGSSSPQHEGNSSQAVTEPQPVLAEASALYNISEALSVAFRPKHGSRANAITALLMVVAMLLVIVLLVLAWSPSRGKRSAQASQLAHLDNAQVLAQFLVIYANIFHSNVTPFWGEPQTGATDWQTWLFDANDVLQVLGNGFSTVCVPLMCFVIGVLSKGPSTEARMRRYIETLVVPMIIWVFFAKPVIYDSLMDPSAQGFNDRLWKACQLNTFHHEWWLQALVLWQGSTFMLWSHLRPSVAFTLLMTLSAIAGYLNLNGPLWYVKLDDFFGFLPYFAIGYFFPFDSACRVTERFRLPRIMALGLVLFWVFVIVPLPGSLPSSQGNYECCTAGGIFRELEKGNGTGYRLYWTRRLTRVALEMPPVLLLMFYVIPRKLTPLSWVGPNYLYPFLFHALANHWRSELVRYLQPPLIESPEGHIAVLIFHFPYAVAVLVFFASSPWRMLFSWCFQPMWLKTMLTSRNTSKSRKGMKEPSSKARQPSAHSTTDDAAKLVEHEEPIHEDRDTAEKKTAPPHAKDRGADEGGAQPETERPRPAHKAKEWKSTGPDLLWQAPARKYYPWLWLLFFCRGFLVFAACMYAIFVWPALSTFLRLIDYTPVWLIVIVWIIAMVCTPLMYLYHYFRLRNTDQLPEPTGCPPLQHAVVVVAYKEPIDVLMRTVNSIVAQRGIGKRPMFVFASEHRDPTAQESFEVLSKAAGDSLDLLLMTKHQLTDGEAVGKSSNEHWAVQQLYQKLVEEQGKDPFEILVTIVDADSVISSTYLAQAEASLRSQCDGRRFIYSGPVNVYRNFGDANIFVQAYELNRCHMDTFHDPLVQYNPQSNYSLTLGFAKEFEFWTPDIMPEDIHTANRAMIHNFGSQTCVAIPSLICNDIVTDFSDRYTQALRHQFGSITEFAWSWSMFWDNKKMSFALWWEMFRRELTRDGSFFGVARDSGMFLVNYVLLYLLIANWSANPKYELCVMMWAVLKVWRWSWFWICELVLWQTLLKQFDIVHASVGRWCAIIAFSPFLSLLGEIVFYYGATIHGVIRIAIWGELTYVAAPKG
mmetsp:Transcript_146801/g.256103  ORF Transcript_146801/g.256103 Transcript_146801/m.256103 type:complete len:1115 (+) Transcript_146801:40-3384(+)